CLFESTEYDRLARLGQRVQMSGRMDVGVVPNMELRTYPHADRYHSNPSGVRSQEGIHLIWCTNSPAGQTAQYVRCDADWGTQEMPWNRPPVLVLEIQGEARLQALHLR